MTTSSSEAPPKRGPKQEALAVFLGEWDATGTSLGDEQQTDANPHAGATPWISSHSTRWHSGEFFLIQDEHANSRGPVNTLSVIGVDSKAGEYFASTFENHGFHRHYDVTVDGDRWTFNGATERATCVISEGGTKQTVSWGWKPADEWLPLCNRIATKQR